MLSILIIITAIVAVFFIGRKRKAVFWKYLVFVLINILLIETFFYGYFLYLVKGKNSFFLIGHQALLDKFIKENILETLAADERSPYSVFRLDPQLGYAPAHNKKLYQFQNLNSQGLRADREYSLAPPEDKLRLAVFGDSFVFCDGELTQNTWAYFLEHSVKNLEVMNFGVSGYGLGQSYLRYLKDGLKFKPDIVFFNYVLLSDRDRIATRAITAGRGLRNADLYRVRFWLDNGVVMSQSMSPVELFDEKFRKHYIYEPLGINPKDTIINRDIFSVSNIGLFIKQLLTKRRILGSPVATDVLSPTDEAVSFKILENFLSTAASQQTAVIFFVKQRFEQLPQSIQTLLREHSRDVLYVNSEETFNELFKQHHVKRQDLLNETSHFNSKGNAIYTQAVITMLMSRPWGNGERKFRFDPAQKAFVRLK